MQGEDRASTKKKEASKDLFVYVVWVDTPSVWGNHQGTTAIAHGPYQKGTANRGEQVPPLEGGKSLWAFAFEVLGRHTTGDLRALLARFSSLPFFSTRTCGTRPRGRKGIGYHAVAGVALALLVCDRWCESRPPCCVFVVRFPPAFGFLPRALNPISPSLLFSLCPSSPRWTRGFLMVGWVVLTPSSKPRRGVEWGGSHCMQTPTPKMHKTYIHTQNSTQAKDDTQRVLFCLFFVVARPDYGLALPPPPPPQHPLPCILPAAAYPHTKTPINTYTNTHTYTTNIHRESNTMLLRRGLLLSSMLASAVAFAPSFSTMRVSASKLHSSCRMV